MLFCPCQRDAKLLLISSPSGAIEEEILSETMLQSSHEPGFTVYEGDYPLFPVLLAVPHAGRNYPAELIANLRTSPMSLLKLEDRYVDRLALAARDIGFTTIVARRARAWIDLNRDPREIDPDMVEASGQLLRRVSMPTIKVRGGLGLIPRRLTGYGELWRTRLSMDQVEARIEQDHRPYHRAIETRLQEMKARFGAAILLDLHSMPPLSAADPNPAPSIVVGDRFGQASGTRFSDTARATMAQFGHVVAINHPYAGGYVLSRHGNPRAGIHALQVEIDRALYLDSQLRDLTDSAKYLSEQIVVLAQSLVSELGSELAIAAE